MAIDSADKRASAIHMMLPFRGMLPLPDAVIGAGDRAELSLLYRGEVQPGSDTGSAGVQTYFISNMQRLMNRMGGAG